MIKERNEMPVEGRGYRSTLAEHPTVKGILPGFIGRLGGHVRSMREFVKKQDGEELRRLMHQLHGAGASYGFEEISARAGAVEKAIGPGMAFAKCVPAVERLIGYIERIEGYKAG